MNFLIANNENGRIYVNRFSIERLVYQIILEDYPGLDCYAVDYEQGELTLHLNKSASYDSTVIETVINKAKTIFNDKYGIYIERVNVILK